MSDLISRAAPALRCARLRTSAATTAKPRPCSPARAASTAALSARRFVWRAMRPIASTNSPICSDASPSDRTASAVADTRSPTLTSVVAARTPGNARPFLLVGGLIYHGPQDRGGDGGMPTYSVSIEPTVGWSIHT